MKIWEFLKDGDGFLSSTRLVYLGWSLALLFLVIYLTIIGKNLPKIEPSLVLLYGTVIGGKVVQSFSENTSNNPKP